MPPVHRWLLCSLGALASGLALAQTAATPVAAPAPPEVDESKIPEWVKRQARSPYKVIIESNALRGRAAAVAAREEGNGKQAQKKTAAAVAPAPPAVELRAEAALARATEPLSKAGSVAALAPLEEPAIETAAALVSMPMPSTMPSTMPRPNATAAALETAAQGWAAPDPALKVATAATAEPMPLTLLRRVEPAIPPEFIDSKLNSAKVVVAFTVNADGEVVKPSIASTSDPRLNRAVLRAVRDWRYAPIETAREHSVRLEFSTQ